MKGGNTLTFPMQAANLAGFRASEDPRFEAGIPDFMNGILNFSIHFHVVHRKVDWRNPKMKSLNSMPAMDIFTNQGFIQGVGPGGLTPPPHTHTHSGAVGGISP